jgi:hypothetical protein
MSTLGPWEIRSATPADQQALSQLLDDAEWLHQHLDWLDSSSFLGQYPFLFAVDGDKAIACLSSPLNWHDNAWIRVFATTSHQDPLGIWEQLWPLALEHLQKEGCTSVVALVISSWFEPLLIGSGFKEINAVIFLEWFPGVVSLQPTRSTLDQRNDPGNEIF